MSDSLWSCGLRHASLLCPSLSPKVCSSSCPLHRWCHPVISSSDMLFFFCPQSLPSGTFSMRLFTSGYQNTGATVSFSCKNTKVLSQSTMWMDLENIILNKKSLMWKDEYCMTPIMWNTYNREVQRQKVV